MDNLRSEWTTYGLSGQPGVWMDNLQSEWTTYGLSGQPRVWVDNLGSEWTTYSLSGQSRIWENNLWTKLTTWEMTGHGQTRLPRHVPSSSSRLAPPPVLMWLSLSSVLNLTQQVAVSPPPVDGIYTLIYTLHKSLVLDTEQTHRSSQVKVARSTCRTFLVTFWFFKWLIFFLSYQFF